MWHCQLPHPPNIHKSWTKQTHRRNIIASKKPVCLINRDRYLSSCSRHRTASPGRSVRDRRTDWPTPGAASSDGPLGKRRPRGPRTASAWSGPDWAASLSRIPAAAGTHRRLCGRRRTSDRPPAGPPRPRSSPPGSSRSPRRRSGARDWTTARSTN